MSWNQRWRGWGLGLAFCAMALLPAQAGPGEKEKVTGSSRETDRKAKDTDRKAKDTDRKAKDTDRKAKDQAKDQAKDHAKKYGKKYGGSNPTGIAIVDADLMMVVQPAALQIQAIEAHQFATGAGVVVAVLDGGFNIDHPAIVNNLFSTGYDAIDGDNDVNDFGNGIDDDGDGIVDNAVGHGTFVSSMVLLAAPNARILPVRVRDDEGYGTNDELRMGIEYAVAMGAGVINLSVESAQSKNAGLTSTIRDAQKAGIVFVVSAGNSGQLASQESIAGMSETIAVPAVDTQDQIAPWSNQIGDGGNPVCAPGVDVYGALGVDSFGFWNGTSFSAGIMSGAAALAREIHPNLDAWAIQDLIVTSVDPVSGLSGSGAGGRINLLTLVTR